MLALLAWSSLLVAEGDAAPTARLFWTRAPGAETCMTSDELEAAVHTSMRRQAISAGPAPLELRGEISLDPAAGSRATIQVFDAKGTFRGRRVVTHPDSDCRAIDQAVTLVVAMLIESSLVESELSLTAEAPAAATVDGTGEPSGLRGFSTSVGTMVATGLVGDFNVGIRGTVGAALTFGRPFVQMGVWRDREEQDAEVSARLTAWEAGVGLCVGEWKLGTTSWEPCVSLRGGRISAQGSGLSVNQSGDAWYLTAVPAVAITQSVVGPLFVQLSLGAGINLVRPRFYYSALPEEEQRLLWRANLISANAELSVGLRLP